MINMFVMKYVVSWLVSGVVGLVSLVGESGALQQLAAGEDNNILTAEEQLRATTNTLFSLLRLRHAKNRPRIQQYSLVHNYFITLTLQDYNSLREIAKLTRVDKENIANIMTDFITLLNDILDEEQAEKSKNIVNSLVGEGFDVHVELEKLEYLRKYHDPGYVTDVNSEILKQLYKITKIIEIQPYNVTSTTTEAPLLDPNQILTGDVTGDILKLLEDNYFRLDFDGTDTLRTVESSMYLHNDTIPHEKALWRMEDAFPSGRRIFHGKTTKIKHFPFMASVQIFHKFQCAGSIIKNDLVITAASCLQLAWNNRFYRENPSFLTIRVGSSFYQGGGDNVGVLEIYFYPSYNPRNLHNNLAVMRLHRKVKWHKNVKKIALDTEEHILPLNTNEIIVAGWGARSASNIMHNSFTDKIQYSILRFYPFRECQEIYSKEYVTLKNFCAGFSSVGSGACNRDVGGPGVVSGMLAGVISFGAPVCGTPDAPTVFTKIGFYYDWIEEIMEQDVPSTNAKTTTRRPSITYARTETQAQKQWTIQPVNAFKVNIEMHPARNNSFRENYDDSDGKYRNEDDTSKEDKNEMKKLLNKMFTDSDELKKYLAEVNRTTEQLLRVANTSAIVEQDEYSRPAKVTKKMLPDNDIEVIINTTKPQKLKQLSLKDIARTSDVKFNDEEEDVNDANRQLIKYYKKLIKDVEKKLPSNYQENQKGGKMANVKHNKNAPKELSHTTQSKSSFSSKVVKSSPKPKQKHVSKNHIESNTMKKHYNDQEKDTPKATEKKHKLTTEHPKKHTPKAVEKVKKAAKESDSDNYESKSEEVFILEVPDVKPAKNPKKLRNSITKKVNTATKKTKQSTRKMLAITPHKKPKEKKLVAIPIKKFTKKPKQVKPKLISLKKKPLKSFKAPFMIEKNISIISPDGDVGNGYLDIPGMSPNTDLTPLMTTKDTIDDYRVPPSLHSELERLKNNIKHLMSDAESSKEDDGFKNLMIEANETQQSIERVFIPDEDNPTRGASQIKSGDHKYIIREGIATGFNDMNNVSPATTPKLKKIIVKHQSPKNKRKKPIKINQQKVTPEKEMSVIQEKKPKAEGLVMGSASSNQNSEESNSNDSKEKEIQQMMENGEQEMRERAEPSPDSNTSDDVILAKSSTESEEKNVLNYININ